MFEIHSVFPKKKILLCIQSIRLRDPDNWDFAKDYCSFSVIGASEKNAKPFSTQFKLSKEL